MHPTETLIWFSDFPSLCLKEDISLLSKKVGTLIRWLHKPFLGGSLRNLNEIKFNKKVT